MLIFGIGKVFWVIWLAFSVIVSVAASKRNRSGAAWFILSLIFSPLLAGLFMLAVGVPAGGKFQAMQVLEVEPRSRSFGPILEKKCPDRAQLVKADARICRFCRHEF